MQEGNGPLARSLGAGGGIAWPSVAIESVPGRICKNRHRRMRLSDDVDLLGWNVLVQFTKVQHHRRLRPLIDVLRNSAAVITNRCIDRQTRCAEPRQRPAQAVAHHANLLDVAKAPLALHGCRNVIHTGLDIEAFEKVDRPLRILALMP